MKNLYKILLKKIFIKKKSSFKKFKNYFLLRKKVEGCKLIHKFISYKKNNLIKFALAKLKEKIYKQKIFKGFKSLNKYILNRKQKYKKIAFSYIKNYSNNVKKIKSINNLSNLLSSIIKYRRKRILKILKNTNQNTIKLSKGRMSKNNSIKGKKIYMTRIQLEPNFRENQNRKNIQKKQHSIIDKKK
jgi:hypothetical protein